MLKVVGITTGKSSKNNDATYMQLHCHDNGFTNPNHIGNAVEKIFVWTSPAGDTPFKQPVNIMGANGSYDDIQVGSYIKPFKESINGLDVITTLMVCDDKGNLLPPFKK